MSKQTEEYNWLDDPFDEKKIAKEQQQAQMSSRSKLAVGIGCLVVLVALVLFVVLGIGALGSLFE
ncbi:MAG TPA: hypothetical protein IAC28_07440 [Candidatus Aphodovivens excrementavium]|nr:hypothetical protein [Candidatus Aphodovivens excrementavium]